MKKYLFPLFLAVVVLFFSGCASKQTQVPITERIQPGVGGQPSSPEGLAGQKAQEGMITEEALSKEEKERRRKAAAEAAVAAHLQDIYFDFDSYAVRSQDIPILKNMADWLLANQAIKLTVEGYCDERGTTEYNLALGQKRAEAAKDYFVKSGVSAGRIKTVSYGKEAPLDTAHTEDAWMKNRRDHFTGQ